MDIRTYSPAEQAAFARHEQEQRQWEATHLTWTQKLAWLEATNRLLVEFQRARKSETDRSAR